MNSLNTNSVILSLPHFYFSEPRTNVPLIPSLTEANTTPVRNPQVGRLLLKPFEPTLLKTENPDKTIDDGNVDPLSGFFLLLPVTSFLLGPATGCFYG